MKRHAMILMLAAALAMPALADITNLSRLGTAYGWQSGTVQSGPGNINDGTGSGYTGHGTYYGSTTAPSDGWYYILWDDVQTVQSMRWWTSLAAPGRGLSSFTLWMLNDGADPTLDTSWTKLGDYDVPNQQYQLVILPAAVSTQAIKLSYTDQSVGGQGPLTGEFEIFGRDMTPLTATILDASPQMNGPATNAVDNHMMTRYGSANLNGGQGFMELSLGSEPVAVGAMQIYFSVQANWYAPPEAFTVSWWDADANDGDGGWVPLYSETGWKITDFIFSRDLASPVVTDKIRLDVITPRAMPSLSGGSFGVAEFYLFAPIPEPATMTLLALGGLALLRRRQ